MTDPTPPSELPEESPTDGAENAPGEALVHRLLDERHDLLVARADFESFFAGYLDHVRRWESEPDDLGQTLMRQGLGAAALHLSCRPPGENVGWTIHIQHPPTNLFLTGDSGEETVTGRIFTEHVKKDEAGSRMFVQTSRAAGPPVQSAVGVVGLDVLQIFEQYYRQSEQTPARFFEISDTEYVLLQALPEADHEWLAGLEREAAIGIAEDELKALDTRIFRFRCGCNPKRMVGVMKELFREKPDELFQGEAGVEISCPRCGRRWWVDREEFLADDDAGDEPGNQDEPEGEASE